MEMCLIGMVQLSSVVSPFVSQSSTRGVFTLQEAYLLFPRQGFALA